MINRQDANIAKIREPSEEIDRLAHNVIGASIEVHRVLGPGYLESIYEEALCEELRSLGVPFVRQPSFAVSYKNTLIGKSTLDLLVGGVLVVELKSVERLAPVHSAQIMSYLKRPDIILAC